MVGKGGIGFNDGGGINLWCDTKQGVVLNAHSTASTASTGAAQLSNECTGILFVGDSL